MAKRSKGLNVAVVDQEVTPQSANSQSVVVSRQTDGDENISTTQRLFGDITETQEVPSEIVQSPTEPEIKEASTETKESDTKEEVKVQETEPVPAPQPERTAGEIPLDGKVRTKVDGKEEEVSVRELRDQFQIRKHLNIAADKVGEERRRLAEERRALMELRQSQSNVQPLPTQENTGGYVPNTQNTESFGALNQKIQFLESQLNQVLEGTKPVVFQSNRQRVSDELRHQGFNDFLDYIPKMESHIGQLQNPQLMNFYDTPEGAKALYFQLKAHDLQESMPGQRSEIPAPREATPSRPAITRIDGGTQPSSSNNDDSGYRYRQSFKRAVTLGDDKEAWNDVLRNKGILPD